jgi:hypothetical protein
MEEMPQPDTGGQGGNNMKPIKTRHAYGTHANGNVYDLGDTVANALKANMMVRDYERKLIEYNPQLKIEIKIEDK